MDSDATKPLAKQPGGSNFDKLDEQSQQLSILQNTMDKVVTQEVLEEKN